MNAFLAAFFVLPPALLSAKRYFRLRISSWWLFAAFVLLGWVLVNLGTWWQFDDLAALAWHTAGASNELQEAAQADGAAQVFGLYLGWAYAAAYFGVWALACSVIALLHGWLRKFMTKTAE